MHDPVIRFNGSFAQSAQSTPEAIFMEGVSRLTQVWPADYDHESCAVQELYSQVAFSAD